MEFASSVTTTTPASAPKAADMNAVASASAARPCFASGYPSNVVATDEGSPGMLNRIDVVEPPNSAPQYIDDSTMMPAIGSMPKVSGSSSATPFGAPRPGNTPTRMPSSTPPAMSARWYGVRAVPNPSISGPRSIIGERQRPSAASSGPLASGTRNHRSNTV